LSGNVPDFMPEAGDLIIPAASDKADKKNVPDYHRFAKFHMGLDDMIPGVIPANVEEWYYKAPSDAPLSASDFRAAIDAQEGLEAFIPDGVDPDEILEILGIEIEKVEEVSAAGAGAVGGFSGPLGAYSENDKFVNEVLDYLLERLGVINNV